jgi:hypothetical protein
VTKYSSFRKLCYLLATLECWKTSLQTRGVQESKLPSKGWWLGKPTTISFITHTHTNTQREWWFPTCNMVSQQMGVFSFLTEDLAGEESSRCSLICGVPLQNVQIMTIFGRLHDDTWCGSVIAACLFMPALCSVHDEESDMWNNPSAGTSSLSGVICSSLPRIHKTNSSSQREYMVHINVGWISSIYHF